MVNLDHHNKHDRNLLITQGRPGITVISMNEIVQAERPFARKRQRCVHNQILQPGRHMAKVIIQDRLSKDITERERTNRHGLKTVDNAIALSIGGSAAPVRGSSRRARGACIVRHSTVLSSFVAEWAFLGRLSPTKKNPQPTG